MQVAASDNFLSSVSSLLRERARARTPRGKTFNVAIFRYRTTLLFLLCVWEVDEASALLFLRSFPIPYPRCIAMIIFCFSTASSLEGNPASLTKRNSLLVFWFLSFLPWLCQVSAAAVWWWLLLSRTFSTLVVATASTTQISTSHMYVGMYHVSRFAFTRQQLHDSTGSQVRP